MLAIRLQRQGRKGYAAYRFIVQDARRSPSSGRVVARIGHYNPHTKEISLDKDKAKFYLDNGAQPSDSIVRIFKGEKIKIPSWVEAPTKQKRDIKNPEKLRKNRPNDEQKPVEEPPKQEENDGKAPEEPKPEEKPSEEEAKESNTEEKPESEETKTKEKTKEPAKDKETKEESSEEPKPE
jgi:small subunit ribosomal protein S16